VPSAGHEIIDFRSERGRHEQFLGRGEVLAKVDRWLAAPDVARGWVLVTGQPGMGKSAILSEWLARAEKGGRPAPHHFLRRGVADWDRPEAVSRSLAAQIERIYPTQADVEARLERRLLDLLGRVSREVLVPRRERLVLVVDGLDEAAAEPGQNPLPLFLPYVLPPGVMVLCGSRPTYPHLSWLEARENVRRIDLDEARWSASNEEVCRELWKRWAPSFRPRLEAGFVDRVLAAGSGNVLYAVKLREWLNASPMGERRVSTLPRGLRGLLDQAWAELRRLPKEQREVAVKGLGVLCAAREALPLSAIEETAGWDGGDAREDFLGTVRPFLLEAPEQWAGEASYRPFHASFREFVAEKVGPKGMREHHRRLLATVAAWPAEGDKFARGYALRHAVEHAIAAGEKEKAEELCRDVGFLEGWCREAGVEAAEKGLKEAGEALGDDEVALLHKVVRAESHWLWREPEAMGELIYNRLRSAGWGADRIEQRMRFTCGLPVYRLRHPVRMGWERTFMGHTMPIEACAVTPDGTRIVSASWMSLKVWDLESGREIATLDGHKDEILACAVTPDGHRIISASSDKTLKVWDLEKGRVLVTLKGHTASVNACATTPDGRRVVSASNDKTLKVWDLKNGRALATLKGHTSPVYACVATPDGRHRSRAKLTSRFVDPDFARQ
jgi:hypothetical protein